MFLLTTNFFEVEIQFGTWALSFQELIFTNQYAMLCISLFVARSIYRIGALVTDLAE